MGLENLCSVKKEHFDKIFKEYFSTEDITDKIWWNKSDFYSNYKIIKIHLINPDDIDTFLYSIFEHIITFWWQKFNTFCRDENIKYIKSVEMLTKYLPILKNKILDELKEWENYTKVNNWKTEYEIDSDLQSLCKQREIWELILFFLTEGLLKSPIALSKISLKTSNQMPVYWADWVHISNCWTKLIFWESKFTDSFDSWKKQSRDSLIKFSWDSPLNYISQEINIIWNVSSLIEEDKKWLLQCIIDPYYNEDESIDNFEYELVNFLWYKDGDYLNFLNDWDNSFYETKLNEKIEKLLKYYKSKESELNGKKITFFLFPVKNTFDILKKYAIKLWDKENLETINSK